MKIATSPQSVLRASCNAPAPAAAPAEEPKPKADSFTRTAFGEAVDSLPKYARGAALGLTTVAPPLVGGVAAGVVGALAGGAAAFGIQYALDKNAGRAAEASFFPTLLGAVAGASQAAPTALRIAAAAGIGVLAGVAAVARQEVEQSLNPPSDGKIQHINKPGEKVDLDTSLVPGKKNVVVFSADWCPACQHLEPGLEKFVKGSDDTVLLKVDIKDWQSPVSEQFSLKGIPHILIYNGQGELETSGNAARDVVDGWVKG